LFFKLRESKNALLKLGGIDADTNDFHAAAQSLKVSDKDFIEMEQRLQGDYSLDAEIAGADGMTALDGLIDSRQNQEEMLAECQENQQLQQKVASVVATLNEKERYIIEHRISADEPLTLQEIASHFSISRERVRQIEENALRKVKNSLLPLMAAV